MNPNSTPHLYEHLASPKLDAMLVEQRQRVINAGVIADLAEQFNRANKGLSHVADPVMIGKLYALQSVQRSHIGVAGFNPMSVPNPYENGAVYAAAAPHHDSFTHNDDQFRTRAIQFASGDNAGIEMIGLNLYIADMDVRDLEPEEESGFIVVTADGKPVEKSEPINGDVSIFAIRNNVTGDAKIYRIEKLPQSDIPDFNHHPVTFENTACAHVVLPDAQRISVMLLSGDAEQEVVREMQAATECLKSHATRRPSLSSGEQRALSGLNSEQNYVPGGLYD